METAAFDNFADVFEMKDLGEISWFANLKTFIQLTEIFRAIMCRVLIIYQTNMKINMNQQLWMVKAVLTAQLYIQ